jgi:hypothetical protein
VPNVNGVERFVLLASANFSCTRKNIFYGADYQIYRATRSILVYNPPNPGFNGFHV